MLAALLSFMLVSLASTNQSFYKTFLGYSLVNEYESFHPLQGETGCLLHCLRDPRCQSFNYGSEHNECELNELRKESETALFIRRPSFTYYEPLRHANDVSAV